MNMDMVKQNAVNLTCWQWQMEETWQVNMTS